MQPREEQTHGTQPGFNDTNTQPMTLHQLFHPINTAQLIHPEFIGPNLRTWNWCLLAGRSRSNAKPTPLLAYLGFRFTTIPRKTTGCSHWITMWVTNQANMLAYTKRWPFCFTLRLGTVEITIRFRLFYDCWRYFRPSRIFIHFYRN